MIKYSHIHHVSLSVRDLEKSNFFYGQVLGLKEIKRPPFKSKGTWYEIGNSGQQLHLLVHEDSETIRNGELNTLDGHLALWVDNYEETIQWLEKNQIVYEARPNSVAGFHQLYITDPDKNIIELATSK